MPAVLPVGYAYRVNHAGGTEYKKYEKYHTVFARFPFLRSASVGSKPRSSQTSFPPRRGMETAAFATVFRALLGRAKSQNTVFTFRGFRRYPSHKRLTDTVAQGSDAFHNDAALACELLRIRREQGKSFMRLDSGGNYYI